MTDTRETRSPPLSLGSAHSEVSVGHQLLETFEAVRTQKVTFKNIAGCFVPAEKLDGIQQQIHTLMAEGKTSVTSDTLLEMSKEIEALKAANHKAHLALEASKAELAAKRGDIDQMEKSITAKVALLKANKIDYDLAVQGQKGTIELLKQNLADAKTSKGFVKESPEAVAANAAEIEELRKALNDAHRNLDLIRGERTSSEQSIKKLQEELESAKSVLATSKKTIEKMEKVSFADAAKAPVHARQLIDNAGRLNKILGSKAVDWLRQADVVARENARDRAFKLLQVARTSRDSKVKSLVEILSIVFEWCKDKSKKQMVKISGFLDQLIADIVELKVRTVQQYRDALVAANANFELKLKEAKESAKPKPSKAKATASWFSTFFTNFVYGTRKSPTPLRRVVGKTKSLFRRLKNWFWSYGKTDKGKGLQLGDEAIRLQDEEDELLFDAEEQFKQDLKGGPSTS